MSEVSSAPVSVTPFESSKHLSETLEVLHRVRGADNTFPPSIDAEDTPSSMRNWLFSEESILLSRWVGIKDGKVIGHISSTKPHAYIENFLSGVDPVAAEAFELGEISKLFVDPLVQRSGAGALLLSAVNESIVNMNRTPVLAVIDTSVYARKLYSKQGMTELGFFKGIHGVNHVFWNTRS